MSAYEAGRQQAEQDLLLGEGNYTVEEKAIIDGYSDDDDIEDFVIGYESVMDEQ
jgi:hypothetical protein